MSQSRLPSLMAPCYIYINEYIYVVLQQSYRLMYPQKHTKNVEPCHMDMSFTISTSCSWYNSHISILLLFFTLT